MPFQFFSQLLPTPWALFPQLSYARLFYCTAPLDWHFGGFIALVNGFVSEWLLEVAGTSGDVHIRMGGARNACSLAASRAPFLLELPRCGPFACTCICTEAVSLRFLELTT